ncbi:unnamed protein product [Caenorhabditis nigoni]
MNISLHIIPFFGFGLAQVTNLVMLVLIHKKAKGLFGNYRHVMTVFTAYSIVYTWIEMIALPLMYDHGSMFILIIDSCLRYEKLIGRYVASLFCGSFALCISLLATQFYYRYVAVCQPSNLGKLNGWRLCLLFIPCIFFFFAWFFLVFFGMKETEEKVEYARKIILEVYKEDITKVAFIALQFWDTDSDGNRIFRVSDWLSYFGCLSIITALPFFTMYSVVGTILTLPMFEISVGLIANLCGSGACVYPALEPLIAMYFVKDFRNTLTCKSKVEIAVANIEMQKAPCNSLRSSAERCLFVFPQKQSDMQSSRKTLTCKKASTKVTYAGIFTVSCLIRSDVLCLYCASSAQCISLQATQFYYRYVAVCQPSNFGKLNGWRLCLLFIPCIFSFIAWFCLVFFAMKGTEEKVEYAKNVILEVYKEDTSKIAFIALQFWDKDSDGNRTFRVSDWLSYLGFLSIITALPFFTMYSVVGTILSLPIFEIDIGLIANYPGFAVCVYPALEPLIAMYFVKDFRNTLTCRSKVKVALANIEMHKASSGSRIRFSAYLKYLI